VNLNTKGKEGLNKEREQGYALTGTVKVVGSAINVDSNIQESPIPTMPRKSAHTRRLAENA
jgi:hypothetical protein